MKTIYFDCFSGISGDMTLGALLDLGVDLESVRIELEKLDLHGYRLRSERTSRHGISATRFSVIVEEGGRDHPHRTFSDILRIIDSGEISDSAKAKARRIFDRLAEAEAKVHGIPKEKVHFHEVGAVDSIVDIVGTAIALDFLEVERIFSSPVSLGRGFTRSAHGIIPIPAPATVELLKDIPVRQRDVEAELTTPTGAAIVSTLASQFGLMPPMKIERVGYGAGSRELQQQPNLLRALLGQLEPELQTDTVVLIETNIDDMNHEMLGYAMEKLFEKGALDVFFTPIYMKKNRPGVKLTVISPKGREEELSRTILLETSTIGVRMVETGRIKLPREVTAVQTPYGDVRVKVARIGDRVKYAPEYESCRQIALQSGIPIREIYELALKAIAHTHR
ncbi:TPA: nickel pincer cofactor biosynthesis protein LarC [Candidatus Poribacteria bacterium]|nr:nickel pincer cofactor biosynthesis protein LarC [Candidatus Poribacteria bacterium]